MDIKGFFNQYHLIGQEIDEKLEQLKHLREFAVRTTQVLTPDKVQVSAENRIESSVQKIIDLESDIEADIKRLTEAQIEIERTVAEVGDPILQNVLRMRYLSNMTWEQIAEKLNYTSRNVYYLHQKALKSTPAPVHAAGS
jgi:DNA-directed RNA polymerase specialized sigma subunit